MVTTIREFLPGSSIRVRVDPWSVDLFPGCLAALEGARLYNDYNFLVLLHFQNHQYMAEWLVDAVLSERRGKCLLFHC
ncbi:hypothetical protein Cadr_000002653 [Camelus dromedarius]|uniref:Uncharacterized protein n=1 Tax=Camelus dromedarius TaxID=9838 RepID=A0A5N4C118_CAMDR|nr:hypothetical protein Cadr_000002653 [Camelus dromedarius]